MRTGGLLLFVGWVCIPSETAAQQPALRVPSNQLSVNWTKENSLVGATIDSTLFVIRQDYLLTPKDGKKSQGLGKDNKPYFGQQYGVGVMAAGQLWTTKNVAFPWAHDPAFKPYAATMQPLRMNALWKTVGQQNFSKLVYFTYDSTVARPLKEVDYYQPERSLPSVAISMAQQPAEGYLALLFLDGPGQLDSTKIQRGIVKTSVTWTPEGAGRVNPLQMQNQLIGGAFFTTRTQTGQIHLELNGLLRIKDHEWWIVPVREVHNRKKPEKSTPPPPPPANPELTPVVSKDSKRKKQ